MKYAVDAGKTGGGGYRGFDAGDSSHYDSYAIKSFAGDTGSVKC